MIVQLCKVCNTKKIKEFIGLNTSGTSARFADEHGHKWMGNTCPDCVELNRISKLKPKKESTELNTIPVLKLCKSCLTEKQKIFQKKYATGHLSFIDEKGSRWCGETCPDCVKLARKEREYAKGSKPLIEIECLHCKNKFKQGNIKQFHCSKLCYYRYHNPPKPKPPKKINPPKPLKEVDYRDRQHCKLWPIINCVTCNNPFRPAHPNHKACKKTHGLAYRKAKRARRAIERYQQPISFYFILELIDIYNNRPEGIEVDHIIPINGENVSGLHVPWNLQYLSPEANNKKSNKC